MGPRFAILQKVLRTIPHVVASVSLIAPAIAQQAAESMIEDAGWIKLHDSYLAIQATLLRSPSPLKLEASSLEIKYDACMTANEADHLLQQLRENIAKLPHPKTDAGIRAQTAYAAERLQDTQSQIEELRAKGCDIGKAAFQQLAEMKAHDAGWSKLLPRVYDVESPLRKADPRFWDSPPSTTQLAQACTELNEAGRQLQSLQADFASLPAPKTKEGKEAQRFLPRYFAGWQNEIAQLHPKVCSLGAN